MRLFKAWLRLPLTLLELVKVISTFHLSLGTINAAANNINKCIAKKPNHGKADCCNYIATGHWNG